VLERGSPTSERRLEYIDAEGRNAVARLPQFVSGDSREAAEILLDRAQVATVPGIVFGEHGEGHLRFSFSTSIETIEAGLDSLRRKL